MWVEDICNLITWPWPHKLLTLSFVVRLGLCLLCFPLCIIIYLLTFPPLHNGSILIIPMGLASWTFSKRGACSCFAGYIMVQVIYNAVLFGSMLWPLDVTFSFIGVVLILFLTGSAVVSLRHLLDSAEAMRLKAEEGERQATIAYEQQQQLNQIKNQFILNVNHELRTLHNLLSNAFKYSPQDTPVVVSAYESTDHEGRLCICVQDAGPGIPRDEIPLLFGQFVRLKRDIGGDVRGSGLGLYICKRLVDVMGGRIWVESEGIAGLGSCFCFVLPSSPERLS